MATRALAAVAVVAGRRGAGQGGLAVLSSSGSFCRRGGGGKAQSFSHSSSTAEREGHADGDAETTAAQVEAALNRKNVEVVQEGGRLATLVAADAAEALGGVADAAAGADDAWVPDQETGVFVPADEASAAGDGEGDGDGHTVFASHPSVLDQTVFLREEEIEDVERPAVGGDGVDVADAGSGSAAK